MKKIENRKKVKIKAKIKKMPRNSAGNSFRYKKGFRNIGLEFLMKFVSPSA